MVRKPARASSSPHRPILQAFPCSHTSGTSVTVPGFRGKPSRILLLIRELSPCNCPLRDSMASHFERQCQSRSQVKSVPASSRRANSVSTRRSEQWESFMSMKLKIAMALFLGAVPLAVAQNSPDDKSQKQTQSQEQIGY